ncbi:hypothetical protein [Pseudomonas sp. CGJS7]|uniref:hypothetical protein n=1 Tax=Pseudomonas sp. CGJS7 TaxID=3109348 RepID=UPI0030093CB8
MKSNRYFVLAIALAATLCAGCDPTIAPVDQLVRAKAAKQAVAAADAALRASVPKQAMTAGL